MRCANAAQAQTGDALRGPTAKTSVCLRTEPDSVPLPNLSRDARSQRLGDVNRLILRDGRGHLQTLARDAAARRRIRRGGSGHIASAPSASR